MTYPNLSFNFRHPAVTSPTQPQNLPRPTAKGCGGPCGCAPCGAGRSGTSFGRMGMGGLLGLKAVGDGYERGDIPQGVWIGYSILSTVSALASAYHGYNRNRGAIGWTVAWFFLGAWFPIITPAVAVFQGYAKPAKG